MPFVLVVLIGFGILARLPAAQLWMGPLSTTSPEDPAKKIAVLPAIQAGDTSPGQVQFVVGGREIMSSFLLSLRFAILGKADLTVDTAVSRTVPKGQLAGKITIGLSFNVSPL